MSIELDSTKQTVRICRRSGLPVKATDVEEYRDIFRRLYDKAAALAKTDMLRLNKRIVTIERILLKKFPSVIEIELPATLDQWKELYSTYGNLLVSSHRDTGEVLFIIEDRETNFY